MEKFNDKGYSVLFTKDAEGNVTGYTVKLKKPAIVTVFLNDRKIKFDQIPVIDNGRTLVPLRAIFEKLGAEIEWNGETKTVTAVKGETKIELTVDSTNATKNGEAVNLDVPAKIVNGRTMIPVRFVADCFGVEVGWNEEMKQVQLTEK
ncbi:MAG: copper amine oxidase N-terminal domain-containing protein [Clostridia bacterium]|nr:copper amine oxidase N-terminal domain-containing protein [Clostridia bacterium]